MNDDYEDIRRSSRALMKTLSVPVLLDHGEVLKLIVADLVAKYKYNVARNDEEWIPIFEKVLHYYLTPEEFKKIIE